MALMQESSMIFPKRNGYLKPLCKTVSTIGFLKGGDIVFSESVVELIVATSID